MDRKDAVLAGLAPAGCSSLYRPVQVQKLFFLIDKLAAEQMGGPFFAFTPYNYGPFDKAVYETLEELAAEGLVELIPEKTWTDYRLTEAGEERGRDALSSLPESVRDYLTTLSEWVRSLSFAQLVSAIYRTYPEMRVNSVFQG